MELCNFAISKARDNAISSTSTQEHWDEGCNQAKMTFPLQKAKEAKDSLAEAHIDWTVEDWKRVIWSDETKINHLRSDRKKWV